MRNNFSNKMLRDLVDYFFYSRGDSIILTDKEIKEVCKRLDNSKNIYLIIDKATKHIITTYKKVRN